MLPAPLRLVLASAAAIAALFWILVLPPLQGPDEEGHFAYTQWIVERGEIPWYPGGVDIPEGKKPYSPEVAVAQKWGGVEPLLANLAARPLWTDADERIWSDRDRALPDGSRATGPPSATFRNPPLYYLYAAAPYGIAHRGSIFDRVFSMRLANVPLLVAVVWLTWLLAAELGIGLAGRTGAAALVGLQPQLLNVTATVGPDVLLVGAWTAGMVVALRLVRQGWEARWAAAALALVVAAGLTHPRAVALAAPVAVALALAAAQRFRPGWRRLVAPVVGIAVVLALLVTVAAAGAGAGDPRAFASYVWQFYLPRLPFMDPAIGPPGYDANEVFVDRIWSGFADLEVTQPDWVTTLMLWLTVALLVAVVALLVSRRRALRERWAVVGIPLLGALALLVVLHVTAYRAMLEVEGDPVITGRHVLALVPLGACAAAKVIETLPRGVRVGIGALVVGAVAMQLGAATALLERFYA